MPARRAARKDAALKEKPDEPCIKASALVTSEIVDEDVDTDVQETSETTLLVSAPSSTMTLTSCQPEIQRAVDLISRAEVILIIAGAGMGVDSGLDKFRGPDGSYTVSDYHEKCQHSLFLKDPHAAWTFHGPVLQRFRETLPHEGFRHLLKLCQSKGSYHVVTSNVDEHFQKAGFEATRVFNAHGSVHFWQCTTTKCNKGHDPWPAGTWKSGQLPQCRYCKNVARPNASLFDDNLEKYTDSFNSRLLLRQFSQFENWLKQVISRRICIIEIGCGVSEHSLRLIPKPRSRWACMSDEWGMAPLPGSLIRIDPEPTSPDVDRQNFVQIHAGAASSLRFLAEMLQSRPADVEQNRPAVKESSKRVGRKAARRG